MAELGAGTAAYHHEVAAAAGEAGVAELIAVGELARGYLDVPGAPPTSWVATAAEATAALAEARQPGDVVLIKGSRSVGLEVVAANLAGT
jgi:UDP-N-acetylmuramoyl-tripeptide--D-alanyl-D-alanine ligase